MIPQNVTLISAVTVFAPARYKDTTRIQGYKDTKVIITLLSGQRYSDAVGYIRKRLRFEILRTTVISLRGDRGARKNMVDIDSLDLNLEPQGQG